MEMENYTGTRVTSEYVSFISGGRSYYFTVDKRLSEEGRQKSVLIGRFIREGDEFHCNETLPQGIEFDTPYCLKEARVFLPLGRESYPQHRQFWDFFPFEGENLRQVIALNDDARKMSDMLIAGTLDPLTDPQAHIFSCAVLEPVYTPFNVNDFPTFHEKIDCMLQIVAGLKQLMTEQTLQRLKIVAHRDLKFNNVVVEKMADGTRRLRLIDFPSVKFTPRDSEPTGNHTCLGFFSYCNTAPEDVMRRYTVSPKTDVFALGTMLAELFEIWNYDGIRNPLMLLFKLANNVSSTDADECRNFYVDLDKRYPFENISVPNWLERALSCHDKNASWNKVVRVCPAIRTLFRAATAIDPHNRITLNNFEKALKQTYNALPEENIGSAAETEGVREEKVMYFLVDTTDLDAFRNAYISAAEQVMQSAPHTRIAMLSYGCRHIKEPQTPDPLPLTLTPMLANEVLHEFHTLSACPREAMAFSALKGCLYDLHGYLGNETTRRSFNGEIHIFAPETPSERNTCYFGVPVNGAGGAAELCALSGQEIAEKFGPGVKIYVHTFREDACTDAPCWYTPVYFPQRKPTAAVAQTSSDVRQPMVSQQVPVAKRDYKKGVGFHFIGGVPLER